MAAIKIILEHDDGSETHYSSNAYQFHLSEQRVSMGGDTATERVSVTLSWPKLESVKRSEASDG